MRARQLAWAYLSRVAEPPCAPLAVLVAEYGPVAAAEKVRRGDVGEPLRTLVEARRGIDCAAADLETLAQRGGRLITPD
ncbi:MAG: DNA processing protein DprA, partial [Mycobacterium sp.]